MVDNEVHPCLPAGRSAVKIRVNMIPHSKPAISDQEIKEIASIFQTGHLAQGNQVREFESALARFVGTKYAVATNSGTSALHLALLSLGVKQKDEIIIPSYVCSAVLNAIRYTGAKPVLVDIDKTDFNLSLNQTRKKLNRRTRAIILPHLFGYAANVKGFLSLGIPIIEDCAQSLGAVYQNRKLGSFGTCAMFSFYATKMITTGYGGMVTSNSARLIEHIRNRRDFDQRADYITRYNYQMSDFQATLGLSQLKRLPDFIRLRKSIATLYDRKLSNANLYTIRKPRPGEKPAFYRYVIRLKYKAIPEFIRKMARKKIEVKRPIYKPLHQYLGLSARNFPITEAVYQSAVSLPIYPDLKPKTVNYVIKSVGQILSQIKLPD